jgi:hypothetical protein
LNLQHKKVSGRLVEIADIKSGQKVLDITTVIGEPAVSNLVNGSGNRSTGIRNNIGYVLAKLTADSISSEEYPRWLH